MINSTIYQGMWKGINFLHSEIVPNYKSWVHKTVQWSRVNEPLEDFWYQLWVKVNNQHSCGWEYCYTQPRPWVPSVLQIVDLPEARITTVLFFGSSDNTRAGSIYATWAPNTPILFLAYLEHNLARWPD